MELVGKNAKTVTINKFHMLKKVGEHTNMVRKTKYEEDGNETSRD